MILSYLFSNVYEATVSLLVPSHGTAPAVTAFYYAIWCFIYTTYTSYITPQYVVRVLEKHGLNCRLAYIIDSAVALIQNLNLVYITYFAYLRVLLIFPVSYAMVGAYVALMSLYCLSHYNGFDICWTMPLFYGLAAWYTSNFPSIGKFAVPDDPFTKIYRSDFLSFQGRIGAPIYGLPLLIKGVISRPREEIRESQYLTYLYAAVHFTLFLSVRYLLESGIIHPSLMSVLELLGFSMRLVLIFTIRDFSSAFNRDNALDTIQKISMASLFVASLAFTLFSERIPALWLSFAKSIYIKILGFFMHSNLYAIIFLFASKLYNLISNKNYNEWRQIVSICASSIALGTLVIEEALYLFS